MKAFYKILFSIVLIAVFVTCSEDTINENGFGTLKGTVVKKGENTPIENAKITTNPPSTTVFTDEDGLFTITDIPSGQYSVQAEKDGFLNSFQAANIVDAVVSNIVFELDISTANNRPPEEPTLVFPPDNATGVDLSVEYKWFSSDPDDDQIIYSLEIRNSTNDEVLLFESLEDTIYQIQDLRLGETYFWQVSATDDINPPVLSSISSFTTIDESENRFYYIKKVGNNNVIYSGGDQNEEEVNYNQYRITSLEENSFRPRKNTTSNEIAFLRTEGAETHLYKMNPDGTDIVKLTTTISVKGFRNDEVDYTWYQNGQRLYFPNLNKLYSINSQGAGINLVYEAPQGVFITEIETNDFNNLILLKTNNADGYEARIFIIDPNGTEQAVIVEGEDGALGGIDFSIDGSKILYTKDVSGFENLEYRQLDSRIFEYDMDTNLSTEIVSEKPIGTNDLDVKYSADNGAVIFMNTSNDGVSEKNIYKVIFDNQLDRKLIFTNASMPDWK